jgi:hypothetical protein
MHPYIQEALAAERVRSLHEEAATRRLIRETRRPARLRWAAAFRWVTGLRWGRRPVSAAQPAAEPACKPAT